MSGFYFARVIVNKTFMVRPKNEMCIRRTNVHKKSFKKVGVDYI